MAKFQLQKHVSYIKLLDKGASIISLQRDIQDQRQIRLGSGALTMGISLKRTYTTVTLLPCRTRNYRVAVHSVIDFAARNHLPPSIY
ncbi:unnamed protein product [Calypogeia fissa]